MSALTVTAKGRIMLKKGSLRDLGIQPGQQIEIIEMPDGELRLRAMKRTGKISEAFGLLKREGQKAISIEEMNEVIAKGWAGKL
jgi:bifunctional DNA-binding transcriptional regulator/antitoxin component of YhaV-PrlF toxin-antitoxin module